MPTRKQWAYINTPEGKNKHKRYEDTWKELYKARPHMGVLNAVSSEPTPILEHRCHVDINGINESSIDRQLHRFLTRADAAFLNS